MTSIEKAIFGDNGYKSAQKPIKKQKTIKKGVRGRNQQKEASMALKLSRYLSEEYPTVLYRFDVGADVKLSINQASKFSKLQGMWSRGYPDLFIAKTNKYYAGLYLELKADGASPYKKDGALKKNRHLEMQDFIHRHLRDEGYQVFFVTGLEEAIKKVDEYMEIER